MRRILITLLFACYWAVMLGPFMTYVGFYANRSRIADTLCEQKLNPVSDCHGSCYLENELAKAVALETTQESTPTEQVVVVHAFSPHITCACIALIPPGFDVQQMDNVQQPQYMGAYSHKLLDPPRV